MPELREGRVRIEDAVVFGNAGGQALRCDLFHPPKTADELSANRPAIVLIHGGAWSRGDRTQLRGYGIALARRGYVCMALEYRLRGVAKWPAQLHDAKAGLRYLRTQSAELRIDPGAAAELHMYEGMPHGFDASRASFRQCVDVMQLFLDRHGCRPAQERGRGRGCDVAWGLPLAA